MVKSIGLKGLGNNWSRNICPKGNIHPKGDKVEPVYQLSIPLTEYSVSLFKYWKSFPCMSSKGCKDFFPQCLSILLPFFSYKICKLGLFNNNEDWPWYIFYQT